MFNVTVIRGKDIVKVLIMMVIIAVLLKSSVGNMQLKGILKKSVGIDNSFLELGIGYGSNIIKQVQKDEEIVDEQVEEVENFEEFALKSVLEIGSNAFRVKEDSNLGQDKKETSVDTVTIKDTKEEKDLETVKTDLITEVVTENPIKETYSQEYNGVKIRNETSFDLTEEILNPDSLEIDKSNILIFHTHTCESYTQSDNFKYDPTRKL